MNTIGQTNRAEPANADPAAIRRSRPAGYQRWRDLLFVHWRVPIDVCQRLLPAGLTIDAYDGSAWIGLVAFRMSGVRPWWFPAVPYLSSFAETNLRTYVRRGREEPGIYFFSLDAARLPAVLVARAGWRLPYHWARMGVERQDHRVRYASHRWLDRKAGTSIAAEIELADGSTDSGGLPAAAGSLEEFLVQRYVFYNFDRCGRLQQGRVRHRPYPLLPARLIAIDESLTTAAGVAVSGVPEHVVFSPGVDVEIVGLQAMGK